MAPAVHGYLQIFFSIISDYLVIYRLRSCILTHETQGEKIPESLARAGSLVVKPLSQTRIFDFCAIYVLEAAGVVDHNDGLRTDGAEQNINLETTTFNSTRGYFHYSPCLTLIRPLLERTCQ